MTQKFKARVYGCSKDERHTLNLASRMETCSHDPFPRTVKDFVQGGFQRGLPSTQKSREHFDFPHNWLDPCCPQSQTSSAGSLAFFNYVFVVEKENKPLFSHISSPIASELLSLTLCLPKLQAIHSEDCFVQGCTSLRAQYLLTA